MLRRSASTDRQHGQTLVEFALVLPLLILLLVGVFDFGRAIFAYNTINNAAREAAREAIVNQTVGDIRAKAASAAAGLSIDPADVSVDFRTSDTAAAGSCNGRIGTATIVGCIAVVQVPYSYDAATPLVGALVGPLTLSGESRFAVEFNCVDGGSVAADCPLGG
jgi:Flp pilus assembly protein TadG